MQGIPPNRSLRRNAKQENVKNKLHEWRVSKWNFYWLERPCSRLCTTLFSPLFTTRCTTLYIKLHCILNCRTHSHIRTRISQCWILSGEQRITGYRNDSRRVPQWDTALHPADLFTSVTSVFLQSGEIAFSSSHSNGRILSLPILRVLYRANRSSGTLHTLLSLRYGSPGRPAAGITCKPRDACGYMVCATNCNLLCNLQFEETELRIATMGYHPEFRSVKVIHYFISSISNISSLSDIAGNVRQKIGLGKFVQIWSLTPPNVSFSFLFAGSKHPDRLYDFEIIEDSL